MSLYLDVGRCVRATSKFSKCTKCIDILPDTIELVDNIPSFPKGTGVEASACVGVCPSEAFSLSSFDTTEFVFGFIESKVRLISPKINIPCISLLSVEHLISLALLSEEEITIDLTSYDRNSTLFSHINHQIEEANFILSSFSDKQLSSNLDDVVEAPQKEEIIKESSRREFLGSASIKGVVKHKRAFDEAMERGELFEFDLDKSMIEKIREKNIPDRRKILFMALKRTSKPTKYEILPQEEISFTSQKFVEESCTNCQICYRICPTGALSSNGKFSLIHFDALMCVKCHLCHDVCEPNAIGLQAGFEIKEFFEPTQRVLAKFNIKRCNECGNNFTYTGGEQACPRCMLEEEEASFLHNNAKLMRGDS